MSALPPCPELHRTLDRRAALRIVRRILRSEDEAEDVVQDVLLRLHTQGLRFDGRAAFTTWLHRVLVNASLNALRARSRRARLETPLPPAATDPEAQAARAEDLARLRAALLGLSAQHRQVVTLRDVRGYGYGEIARRLGIPEGTVKSALSRGRARLQAALQEAA